MVAVTLGALCAYGASQAETEEPLVEHTGQPKYLELAKLLRQEIASGRYPVGSELPSTARLTESFGVSTTVVRAAIRELRTEGLVVGQPGKAVYVRATPDDSERPGGAGLEEQLRELTEFVRTALDEIDTRLTALEGEHRPPSAGGDCGDPRPS